MMPIEQRIEEFQTDGRNFISFDLSGMRTNRGYMEFISEAKYVITKYEADSVYTIVNLSNILFDSESKEMLALWIMFNKPYVRYGAIYGVDGIKKIMINSVLKISGRINLKYVNNRQEAMEWLTRRE